MRIIFALLLAITFCVSGRAQVLPNDAIVDGKTMGDWSVESWKWVFLSPTNQQPLFDTDGSRANNGQPDGSVFFLAGVASTGSGMVVRRFTVPEDKYLFFPVAAVAYDDIATGPPPFTLLELRDFAAGIINGITEFHAGIDGVSVSNLSDHRVISPVFGIDFTNADNLTSYVLGRPFTGVDDPIVADGYYLMLSPLSPGPHVINFGATFGPPQVFVLDITDYITVVPIPLWQRVSELMTFVQSSGLVQNRKQPLLASLSAAYASFQSTNLIAGINQLNAFQNKVRAQLGRTDVALANELIHAAQQIIDKATDRLNQPHPRTTKE